MKNIEPVFKEYVMDQQLLFPPNLSELIPQNHLVRVVNTFIDGMDLEEVKNLYKGGGTSSYHYRMMLKALIYSYTEKIYSSRRIAKALRENIHFMWIAGSNKPDFRTINRFRLMLNKTIGKVFYKTIELLFEQGLIKLENYFLDGTKIEANANKYSFVWRKSMEKNKKKLEENVRTLLKQIDQENELENQEFGENDLPEMGENIVIDKELLKRKAMELSERIKKDFKDKQSKKALKKIEADYLPRLEKYEEQESLFNGRNSYSKTDTDATFMRMKEDHMMNGQLKPGYNIQIGTENQFIIGYSVHQRPNDTTTFIPHMEKALENLPEKPRNVVTDAGYGSEENYDFVQKEDLGNYLKYNQFYVEQTRKFKRDVYRTENLPYNMERDEYQCPQGKVLEFSHIKTKKTENGYLRESRVYECESCDGCPVRDKCHKGQYNRRIEVSEKLNEMKREARKNLDSAKGIELRKKRSIEPETCFGDIKWNAGFRRFMLRGLDKVGIEWGLLSIGHNMRKLFVVLGLKKANSSNLSFSYAA